MVWMDCLANFEPLQPDFNCVKACKGKMVNLGVVFCQFGGLMGPPGVMAKGLDVLGRG